MSAQAHAATRDAIAVGEPILSAKLRVPGLPPWAVTRPRLVAQLSRGVTGPLTLVSGPAGSGKTVLASSWAVQSRRAGRITWINLGDGVDWPRAFWSYVVQGLAQTWGPVPGADPVQRCTLAGLAEWIVARAEPVILVLDGAETLTDPLVLDQLDFVVRNAAPRLRLVLLARNDPSLPLHRYRVNGSVAEIRLDELLMTPAEVRAAVQAHGVSLSQRALDGLVARTDGWPVSVRLAARLLQRGTDPDGEGWTVQHERDVAEYFRSEVLNAQPPDVREFLLRTSLAERLWPGLATVLSGRDDARATLATIARGHLFADADLESADGFRYRPAFAKVLRTQLALEVPAEVSTLHRTAAQWLAGAGHVSGAIRQAAAGRAWDYAAALVVDASLIGALLEPADPAGVAQSFAAMPDDVAGPEGAVVYAALALANDDPDRCAKHLLRAGELVGDGPNDRGPALRLAIGVLDAARHANGMSLEAGLAASLRAVTLAGEMAAAGTEVPACTWAVIHAARGEALLRAGQLEPAATSLASAVEAAGTAGRALRARYLSRLALTEALRGRLRRARTAALDTVDAGSGRDAADRRPFGAEVALAWVYTETCEVAAARVHAGVAAEVADGVSDSIARTALALVQARLHRARGDHAAALATLQAGLGDRAAHAVPGWMVDQLKAFEAPLARAVVTSGQPTPVPAVPAGGSPYLVLARAGIALRDGDTYATITHSNAVLGLPGVPLDARVAALLHVAAAQLGNSQLEQARTAVERALALAAPERLRRPVVEAPPPVRRLLREDDERLASRHSWLGAAVVEPTAVRRASRAQRRAREAPPLVVEALTDKESEVLHCLAALLSTEEIARKMFVSVNTVKTHVRGILRKLAATRRNEAIRRARQLGLL